MTVKIANPMPPWLAAPMLVLGTVLLSALFVPVSAPGLHRVALDPRPSAEILVLVEVLALLALMGWRLPRLLRWGLGVFLALLAVFHLAGAVVLSFFERDLDLYFDLPQIPNLVLLFAEALGPIKGWLAVACMTLGVVGLVMAIAILLGSMERALAGPYRAPITLAAAGLCLALVPMHLVSTNLSREVAQQTSSTLRAWRIMQGEDAAYGAAFAAPPPQASDLSRLKHRDIYLVFFESYGTILLDDPRFAPVITPALAEFERSATASGYYIASNRIVSPAFGGGSWLAHGTIASGVKLDPFLYRLLPRTGRPVLTSYLKAAGYDTMQIMPGLKVPMRDASYWGFDRTIAASDLDYNGPAFGWFAIPDQYTLKVALERVDAAPHKPQFTQIVLVSSHTPFAPLPPYLDDWSDAGSYKNVPPEQWDKIRAAPDWAHLDESYRQAVIYDLETLAGWLAQLKGQPLVIILGDHQPPGFVSGAQAPHTVPIHILSRDPDLVLPFARLGYVAGIVPPHDGSFPGMEDFLPEFLSLFASGHQLALGGGD